VIIYVGLAELYNKFRDIEKTVNFLTKAEKLSKSRNADKELMKIHTIYNDCFKNGGDYEKAVYHLEQSKFYAKKILDFDEEKKVRSMLLGKIFDDSKLTNGESDHSLPKLKDVLSRGYQMTGLRKH